ncbi:recQ-mediated genome instability protein 1-like [Mercenaria mercenaria]|uniref:recQ-mediated genome instability protein 1-like n=1 Tax=Mercenaria mercenaria TaxID=6596 RepID=UPI00234F74FF|nr:recQ-mediated genome instability protein 1-like [Mercenaria mercenaria]
MHVVKKTGDWLKGNHILVNDDWLKACVEWIQEENQGQGLPDEDINSQVYEQWLLADLHELETCCLPAEIRESQKYELCGTYALQIDSIVDVGVSFYSQQQKLKGTENANVHVNAEEPTQKPWEPKPSRMLMFKLTDGTHCLQGMEYRPISCLSPQTSPGAKILVHGSVLCRHGVLMLSDNNIKFLGGEVDTLVEANTVLNTLQSAMEASEEHAGKDHRQTFAGTPIRHCNQPLSGNQVNQGNQSSSWGNSRNNYNNGNQFSQRGNADVKPSSKMKTEPITQSSFPRNNQVNNQTISGYDEFMDDDMDGIMEEMTDEDFGPAVNMQNRNSNQNFTNSGTTNQNAYSNSRQHGRIQNNNIKVSNSQRNKGMENRGKVETSSVLTDPASARVSNRNSVLTNEDLVAMEFEDDMDFPPMDDDFMTSPNTGVSQHTNQSLNNVGNRLNANNRNNQISSHTNVQNVTGKINNSSTRQNSNMNSHTNPSTVSNTSHSASSNSSINLMDGSRPVVLNNVDMTVNISNKGVNWSITSRTQDSAKTAATAPVNRSTNTKLCLPKTETERKTDAIGSSATIHRQQQSSIESFLTPNKKVPQEQVQTLRENSGLDIQTEYPFTYLVKVMSLPVKKEPSYHTVKAYISTLTSKLTTVGGKWTLACKVNDGTMAVDVDLSNQVLTEMIGFSPKEAQEMKMRIKTDPGVKEVLQEGIQQCQQKLIELMCLLELEICAQNPRPVIVATKQLTTHHIDMLYNRVMAGWNTGS